MKDRQTERVERRERDRERDRRRCIGFSVWIDCFWFLVSFSFVLFSFGLASAMVSLASFFCTCSLCTAVMIGLALMVRSNACMHALEYSLIIANASREKKISILNFYLDIFLSFEMRTHAHEHYIVHFSFHFQYLQPSEIIHFARGILKKMWYYTWKRRHKRQGSPFILLLLFFFFNNRIQMIDRFITSIWSHLIQ